MLTLEIVLNAPTFPARRSLLLVLAAALPLAACGFKLRGVRELPFQTLFLNANRHSELTAQLRRAIEAQTTTRVVDDAKGAEAVLDITENKIEKVILSLNSAGRVREYQLRQRFSFKVRTPEKEEIAPVSTIELRRDLTFNDTDTLAKQQEEELLYAEMQSDLIQQVLRRLQSIRRKAR